MKEEVLHIFEVEMEKHITDLIKKIALNYTRLYFIVIDLFPPSRNKLFFLVVDWSGGNW